MTISIVLATGWNTHFGGPTDALSKAVGTGSNRYAIALTGYSATGSQPAGFSVGSDTLALIGSVTTISPSGFKWAVYGGALTQTGTQTCTATFSGTFGSGFSCTNLLVIQGTGALTVANFSAPAESASGGAGNTPITITTTAGDIAIQQIHDLFTGSTYSAHTGSTAITYDIGYVFADKATASGSSTSLQADWAGAFDCVQVGYSVTEAGGGGGGGAFGRPYYNKLLGRIINV